MAADERTSRTPPPSFAPGTPARPVRPADAQPIVVGRPSRPTAPQRTPRPAPGGDARASTGRPPTIAPTAPSARPPRTAQPVEVSGRDPKQAGPAVPAATAPRSTTSRPATSRPPQPTRPAAARQAAARPPGTPTGPRTPSAPEAAPGTRRNRRLLIGAVAVVVLGALLVWPIGLTLWANGKVQHTPALSGAAGTPGTTYLLTGSDSRADGGIEQDGTEGARTDTILLLHVPDSGPTALISLPRDTYVEIPGNGSSKLNAAFSWGGAPLLVQTVEGLTGLTVDHYAEIGMAGVEQIVDAVGGVNLCYDAEVNDVDSGMVWTPGCHDVDGTQALAFARMRKSDPTGDVGRALRQRQLIGAVMSKVKPSQLVAHPGQQVALIDAGTRALTVSDGSGIIDMAQLALAFRAANGEGGITGTPPIASMDYRPGNGVGSTVQLDPETTPAFWAAIRDGSLPPGPVGGVPGT
ncbi:LCP family protein [Cellulomonas sp. Root485]|uniref:LCP family protein n=1 Tax=Cellulomonas sp. Root485 TaxID=1736546 RepID=UPI0009EA8843|nr:LCP family protein [Cellulomonas sp. Root485]